MPMSAVALAEDRLCHAHAKIRSSERQEKRIRWVVIITFAAMIGELAVGVLSGSLALVAEGWHMGCHAGALGLSALAYWFARTRAHRPEFAFGTGKVHSLAGYTNALLLILVSIFTIVEGARRLFQPVAIDFREALPVAVVGLVINLACVNLLHVEHDHDHGDHHDHHDHHDHNLRAAYLHVLGDLLTSVAALGALVGARYAGLRSLDPVMAVVSSVIVLRWGVSLCRLSSRSLLDLTPTVRARQVRERLESLGGVRILDLHLWELGPGRLGCIVSLASTRTRPLADYHDAICAVTTVEHVTVEVTPC